MRLNITPLQSGTEGIYIIVISQVRDDSGYETSFIPKTLITAEYIIHTHEDCFVSISRRFR
jgi:hypothetical protein